MSLRYIPIAGVIASVVACTQAFDIERALPLCGDGETLSFEVCDDGNRVSSDGCSATCTIESGWNCTGEPSACSSICGDGLRVANERCDDQNETAGDGCHACQVGGLSACVWPPEKARETENR